MKKLIILGLCILLMIPSVFADENILNRLFKGDKLDNEVCDDGENVFLNDDCKLDFEEFKTGEFFMHMWFIRLLMIVALIMFIRKDTYLLLVIIFILILIIAQGTFGDFGASKVNEDESEIEQTSTGNISTNISLSKESSITSSLFESHILKLLANDYKSLNSSYEILM